MIAFKEAGYLIGASVSSVEEAVSFAQIASKVKRPIELVVGSSVEPAALRDVLSNVEVPVVLAGSIAQSAAVDLVLVPPDPVQIATLAEMRKPFACLLDAARLRERIEALDENPERRPWHYVVTCNRPSEASEALAQLFREAPPLAHRVAGVRTDVSSLDRETFETEIRDCVKTFGLQLASVTGSAPLVSYLETLARI